MKYFYIDFHGNDYLIGETFGADQIEFANQEYLKVSDRETWYDFLRAREIDRFFLIDAPFCIRDESGRWCSFVSLFHHRQGGSEIFD